MTTHQGDGWPFWRRYLNVAQPRLGARVLEANDEFFGAAERLIHSAEPVFIPGKYDDHGKWMDGWETRRRRTEGHDWCVVELPWPTRVFGVDIDTRHFNGNQPLAATIDAETEGDDPAWESFLDRVELGPDSQHRHDVSFKRAVTRLRLNIFPDGGVARLRVYGLAERDWGAADDREVVDLAAAENGASIVAASDEHFGIASNLLLPGRGLDMGDGWETARRRGPGYDWVIVRLATPGVVERVVLDTAHFKGNFPHEASLQAASASAADGDEIVAASGAWPALHEKTLLRADAEHELDSELTSDAVSHVRLNIYPDGGVSRLRVFGRPAESQRG